MIYNSYKPKYDNQFLNVNYESNTLGYIGRHVPRKRPELPIVSVNQNKINDVTVINMGVDYDKYDSNDAVKEVICAFEEGKLPYTKYYKNIEVMKELLKNVN